MSESDDPIEKNRLAQRRANRIVIGAAVLTGVGLVLLYFYFVIGMVSMWTGPGMRL